ncbi:MAG: hypothetical protein JWN87_2362, partial [Frankiales bacterium]|nr:hypothetical protein [Frankiales bacterium]
MTEALFIHGKPRTGSGELLELRSRRDGSLLASMAGATAADVADAYTSAVAAQDEWAARPPGG